MYDDIVMDHIKNARNYRVLDDADRRIEGRNPLCGDELLLFLKVANERIDDLAFQCSCCGISMASTSMMTEMLKGTRIEEAKRIADDFVAMLESGTTPADETTAERLAMLDTVSRFPARRRCALLPWTTLSEALESGER